MKVVMKAKRDSFRKKVRDNFDSGWDLSSHTSTKKTPVCLPLCTFFVNKKKKIKTNIFPDIFSFEPRESCALDHSYYCFDNFGDQYQQR